MSVKNVKNTTYLGIDIGGANFKVVGLDKNRKVSYVYYKKCPVWHGTKYLEDEISFLNEILDVKKIICGITMTAELCDNFIDRNDGVKKIKTLCKNLKFKYLYFNNKTKRFFDSDTNNLSIASMNWLSTARFIQSHEDNALVVDFGSTTTDVLVIKDSKIKNKFYSDFDRINNNELIYTGCTRTPIFSILKKVKFKNSFFQVIPEFFSNTADLYRVKLMLDNSIDLFDTTDFRNKSVLNSMKRISRNLAIDYNKKNIPFILKIVDELIYEQKKQIFTSINNLIKLHKLSKNLPIITCGIGKDIIKKFALSEGYNTSDFSSYIFGSKKNIDYASMHAPALSCAFLVSSFK